jgi:hypothetical protein
VICLPGIELDNLIANHALQGDKAPFTTGFCWPWSKPNSDGTLADDVALEGFSRP